MSKVNLKRLASGLSLSISTVSKALRQSHEISETTKQKVLQKAKELGYQPNPYASYMRNQKSKTIAIIIPEMNNNFFLQVINGAESVASEKGYHILIYITHEDAQREISIINHLQNGRVDGIIMSVASQTRSHSHLTECMQNNVPIVFFDRICYEIETIKITTDDFASGFMATEHLIQNGCKNLAYLSISENLSIDNKRLQGFTEALVKHNLPFDKSKIIRCTNDEKSNRKKIRHLLATKEVDGIFSSVEKMALTTYSICEELNLKIPAAIKIVCFSNLAIANFLAPSLTTVTQPANEMGIKAASMLLKHLDKKRALVENEHIVIKSTLNIRESSVQKKGRVAIRRPAKRRQRQTR